MLVSNSQRYLYYRYRCEFETPCWEIVYMSGYELRTPTDMDCALLINQSPSDNPLLLFQHQYEWFRAICFSLLAVAFMCHHAYRHYLCLVWHHVTTMDDILRRIFEARNSPNTEMMSVFVFVLPKHCSFIAKRDQLIAYRKILHLPGSQTNSCPF